MIQITLVEEAVVTRTLRMLGVIALACGTVPLLGATPAYAETAAFNGAVGGYFSSTGIRKPDQFPASIPEGVQPNNNGADGVSKDNLAVAARANQVDKLSFVLFDLLSLQPGTVVTKAVLRMPVVPNSPQDATFNATPEKVVACPSGDEGFFGEDGASSVDAPKAHCDKAMVAGKASADGKAYEFDITKIAAGWIDMNDGVALVPAENARVQPFQVVFAKATDAKLTLEYTAPPPQAPIAPPVFQAPPTTTTPPVDLGGFGGGSVAAPPALDTATVPMPALPPAPAPVAGVAPQAPAPTIATTPVALETLRPDNSLWLGALALAGLLALLSLIMGDSRVPTRAGGTSRLSQALADRQRAPQSTAARPGLGRSLTA